MLPFSFSFFHAIFNPIKYWNSVSYMLQFSEANRTQHVNVVYGYAARVPLVLLCNFMILYSSLPVVLPP